MVVGLQELSEMLVSKSFPAMRAGGQTPASFGYGGGSGVAEEGRDGGEGEEGDVRVADPPPTYHSRKKTDGREPGRGAGKGRGRRLDDRARRSVVGSRFGSRYCLGARVPQHTSTTNIPLGWPSVSTSC
jgi:hypothetical protein